MYPDLSYLLHDLIGTSPDNWTSIIKTFGLLLVISFLVAAYMLGLELKRKEDAGLLQPTKEKTIVGQAATLWELVSNALLGFFIGFKFVYIVQHFSDFQLDPADVILSVRGNWFGGIIGAILFAALKYYEKDREKLPKPVEKDILIHPYERIGDITILAAISGIVGAKLFALAEDLGRVFDGEISFSHLVSSFFSGSGLAIYGGLIVAFFCVYFYVKRKGITPIHVMDAVAPALMIAYGIGRMGCHFSGDGDWGIPNEMPKPEWMAFLPDWLWAYDYPHNVIREGVPMENCNGMQYCTRLDPPVYPTPVYETTMAFILGGVLWALRKRILIPGMLFFIYVILNGVERFFIEKIRVNIKYDVGGLQLTQAEIISICMMIIGVIGCLVLWRRHKAKAA
ncbi:MAG: prolipoprotein diacylglyceryl transferase family protein [Bacteroidota bacterium]